MENNDIITTEAIEEITEAVPTGNSNLKTAATVGVIGAASVAAWEFVVKPAYHWAKRKIHDRKAFKKAKMVQAAEPDEMKDSVEEIEVDE